MIHNLNIQRDVDYYVMTNVVRPYNAAGNTMLFSEVRYVNTFLHPDIPETCNSTFVSSTANAAIPCPEGTTQPLSAPPPLKQNHQNYNSASLNEHFRRIEQLTPNLTWNFGEAVYVSPEQADMCLTMRCLAHTYGGRSVIIQNLQELINSVTEQTQIIGLHGHSTRFIHRDSQGKITYNGLRGRIFVGRQQILEDMSTIVGEPVTENLTSDQVLLTDTQIQQKLRELGSKMSGRAVIVLYHCHNGKRTDFLQRFADWVDKIVFAYTGFLGWYYSKTANGLFTVNQIRNNWGGVLKKLLKQEIDYQPEKDNSEFTSVEGDWVATTPLRFDGLYTSYLTPQELPSSSNSQ